MEGFFSGCFSGDTGAGKGNAALLGSESAPFIRQPAGIWVELCFELLIHESRFTVHGNKPDPHPPAGGLALIRMTAGSKA